MTEEELQEVVLENQANFGTPEEVEKFDPHEAEQEALAQAEQAPTDPFAAAATMYGLYMPKFLQGVKRLSSRGRTRVLKALVEYPLQEKDYIHSSQLEKEMMAVGNAVLEAKFLMILSTYNNDPRLQKAMDPNAELTEEEVQEILDQSPEEVLGETNDASGS